ncbi:MAG: stage V sporulation protein AA [Lachnospiraceae bacterium]
MAVKNETLYIKGEKNVEVTKQEVTLGDLLSMHCAKTEILPKLKTLRVYKFHDKGKKRVVVSVLKLIELIQTEYPELEVENLGEIDLIVTHENQQTPSKFMHFIKAALIVLTTFIGSAFSVMAFNSDTGIVKLFGQIYEQFMGYASTGFTILELTYCLGLIIGILVFFNHFGKRKSETDPTPMEIEMRLYENDIYTTLMQDATREKEEIDVN